MPTKMEAKREALLKWSRAEDLRAAPGVPDLLGALLEWAIQQMARKNDPTTIAGKRHLAKVWTGSPFASESCRGLSREAEAELERNLQEYLDNLQVTPKSESAKPRPASAAHRRNAGSLLNQAFKLAGVRITLQLPSVRDGVHQPLTKTERRRLREACETETETLAVALMMDMGLRRGEAVGALWEDYADGQLLIQRDLARIDGQLTDHRLKTARSKAPVPVPEHVRPLFESGRTGFILGDGLLDPMLPESATRLIPELCGRAGIRRVTPQALRATHDQMVMDTVRDPRIAADLARHDVGTMVRHYLRATPETRAAARRGIDAAEGHSVPDSVPEAHQARAFEPETA